MLHQVCVSFDLKSKRLKEHMTTEEEIGETNFILRIKEQETRLTLQGHDDDEQSHGCAS